MKVLIIRLSAMGDTVHCLPVAAALKRCIPGVEVFWLVEPASAPLVQDNEAVDKVFVLPKKKWLQNLAKPWLWPLTLLEMGNWIQQLRKQHFDAVIDFQGLLKSALCAWASGCPYRLGFAHAREGAPRLMTHKVEVGDYFFADRHVVDTNLLLLDYLTQNPPSGTSPGYKIDAQSAKFVEFPLPAVPANSSRRIADLLMALNNPDKDMVPLAVLIPGTTWDTKIWPADQWIKLGQKLVTESGYALAIIGGPSEKTSNAAIAQQLQALLGKQWVVDLTAATSLLDLLALYQLSSLVVGGDSGPLHLAAASNYPQVVGVFGSTPTYRNGPYGNKGSVVSLDLWCQPCFEKHCPLSTIACLRDLNADAVYEFIAGNCQT